MISRRPLAPLSAALVVSCLAACGDAEGPTPDLFADTGTDAGMDIGDASGDGGTDDAGSDTDDVDPGDADDVGDDAATDVDPGDAGDVDPGDTGDTDATDTGGDTTTLPEVTATQARILSAELDAPADGSTGTDVFVTVAADGYPGPVVATIVTPDDDPVEVQMDMPALHAVVLHTGALDEGLFGAAQGAMTFERGALVIPLTGWSTRTDVDGGATIAIDRYTDGIQVTVIGTPEQVADFVGVADAKGVDDAAIVTAGGRAAMTQAEEYAVYTGRVSDDALTDNGAEIRTQFVETDAGFTAEPRVDREPVAGCLSCSNGQFVSVSSSPAGVSAVIEVTEPGVWFSPASTRLHVSLSLDGGAATTTALRNASVLTERVFEVPTDGALDAAIEVTLHDRAGAALGTYVGTASGGGLSFTLNGDNVIGVPASALEEASFLVVNTDAGADGEDIVSVSISGAIAAHVADGWIELDGIVHHASFARDYGQLLAPVADPAWMEGGVTIDLSLTDGAEAADVLDRVVQPVGGGDGPVFEADFIRRDIKRVKIRRRRTGDGSYRINGQAMVVPDPPATATAVVAAGYEEEGDDVAFVWAIVRGEGPASGLQATVQIDELAPSGPVVFEAPDSVDVLYVFDRPDSWETGARQTAVFTLGDFGSATLVDGELESDVDPGLDNMDWFFDARGPDLVEMRVRGDLDEMIEAGMVPELGEEPTVAMLDGVAPRDVVSQRNYFTLVDGLAPSLDGSSVATLEVATVGSEAAVAETTKPWLADDFSSSMWVDEEITTLTLLTEAGTTVNSAQVEMLLASGEVVRLDEMMRHTAHERAFAARFPAPDDGNPFNVTLSIRGETLERFEVEANVTLDAGWMPLTATDSQERFVRVDTRPGSPGDVYLRVSTFQLDGAVIDSAVSASVTHDSAGVVFDGDVEVHENTTVFEMDSIALDDIVGWQVTVQTDGDEAATFEYAGVVSNGPFELANGMLGFGQVIGRSFAGGLGALLATSQVQRGNLLAP